jgi:hypothetical protein
MKRRVALTLVALAGILLANPRAGWAVDELAAKERVGARVGGIVTFDDLDTAYGGGWDLTLFFTEKLAHSFYLDVRVGAIYLGELKLQDLAVPLTNIPVVQGDMRVLYFSVGPMLGRPLGGGYAAYASAAAGIYSSSMTLDRTTASYSDQYFGFNGGLGFARRLSTNWSLDANVVAHYFFTEEELGDVFHAFTGGASDPLILDVAFGVVVDLR